MKISAATGVCVVITGEDGDRPGALTPLLGLARRLAERVTDDVTLLDLGTLRQDIPLETLGVENVIQVRGPALSPIDPRPAARALADVLAKRTFSVVLLSQTPANDALAARVAARLETGLASSAIQIDRQADGGLLATRAVCDGRASCVLEYARAPQIATVDVDALPPAAPPEARRPVVEKVRWDGDAPTTTVELLEEVRPSSDSLALTEAPIVVGGGLGAGLPETAPLLQALAAALRAPLAGSRPVIDRGWLPRERLVGQSGYIISPDVYLACGISGSPQHLVGMRGARAVIALNKDPGAPIMKLADLAIVGDCRPVLEELMARLRPGEGGGGEDDPA